MFTDKVVIVTGSSTGIGAGTVTQFAKAGAKVVVTGLECDQKEIDEVAEKCRSFKTKQENTLVFIGDLSIEENVAKLLNKTIQTFEKLDILVNNVGICLFSDIDESKALKVFDKIFSINVRSGYYLTHLAVPFLEKTKGVIINVSSISSTLPTPERSAYCMSKSAIDMFTKCLALELGPRQIRVVSVNPGTIQTNIMDRCDISKEQQKIYRDNDCQACPLRRNGSPEDVAKVILFLASEAADFITGSHVHVDGGGLHTARVMSTKD